MSNLPQMKAVQSTSVTEVGYDAENSLLYVRFKGGALYRYFNVTASEWATLNQADSVGQYVNAAIKPSHGFEKC